MRVFYWGREWPMLPSKFYQVDTEVDMVAQVPGYEVNRGLLETMLNEGFTEITWQTADRMGLPV